MPQGTRQLLSLAHPAQRSHKPTVSSGSLPRPAAGRSARPQEAWGHEVNGVSGVVRGSAAGGGELAFEGDLASVEGGFPLLYPAFASLSGGFRAHDGHTGALDRCLLAQMRLMSPHSHDPPHGRPALGRRLPGLPARPAQPPDRETPNTRTLAAATAEGPGEKPARTHRVVNNPMNGVKSKPSIAQPRDSRAHSIVRWFIYCPVVAV